MPRRRRFRWNVPYLAAIAVFALAIAIYIGVGVALAMAYPRRIGLPADLKLALIARSLDATIAIWFFAVGASIGSFLNVVAYRLPLGRTLGGHSACPFCCTTIAATDNIPVFAWLRLRGRCRHCRLPISIQYPLVELAVGLAFLAVYFFEFSIGGSNLPGSSAPRSAIGLIWTAVTQTLAMRVLLFVITLSGLIAAALIVARHCTPPLVLFVWIAIAVAIGELIVPSAVVVPWWPTSPEWLPDHPLVHSAAKLFCGLVVGLGLAFVTWPFRKPSSGSAAWFGVIACVGVLLGWQAVGTAVCTILLVTLAGYVASRIVLSLWSRNARRLEPQRVPVWLADPVVWAWLGLMIHRANWRSLDSWSNGAVTVDGVQLPSSWPIFIAMALTWVVQRVASGLANEPPSVLQPTENTDQSAALQGAANDDVVDSVLRTTSPDAGPPS